MVNYLLRVVCAWVSGDSGAKECTFGEWSGCVVEFGGNTYKLRNSIDCELSELQACKPSGATEGEGKCTAWSPWTICRDGMQTRDCKNLGVQESRPCSAEGETDSCGE